jgi:hypothetical protein
MTMSACRYRLVGLFAPALALVAPAVGAAQEPIRVAVNVTDAEGTLAPAVNAALADIGDVTIVTLSQPHDVALRLVALCTNTLCDARAVSIALTTPVSETPTSRFDRLHEQSVAVWGSGTYERAARSLIQTIDSACFDSLRGEKRAAAMLAAGDTAAARVLGQETSRSRAGGENWDC